MARPRVVRGIKRGIRAGVNGHPLASSDFPGSYPSSMSEVAAWTGADIWTIGWNFKDLTGSPNSCPRMSGSASRTLGRLEGGSPDAENVEILAPAQDGYADQGGICMDSAPQMLFVSASEWALHPTQGSIYLFRVRFDATPVDGTQFIAGVDGSSGGFSIQAHPTSGIRALIGNGSSYVSTSYIGGTSLYDGEWHTILLAVDDAAGKAKLICEFAETESTGLTITTSGAFVTIGATFKGDVLSEPVSFLFAYGGVGAGAYASADSIFDTFEESRLAGGA